MYILHFITCTCCFLFTFIWESWWDFLSKVELRCHPPNGQPRPRVRLWSILILWDILKKAKRVKSLKDALLIFCRSTGWRTRWRSKLRGTTTSSSLLMVTSSSSRLDNFLSLHHSHSSRCKMWSSKMSKRNCFQQNQMYQVTKLMLLQVRPDDVGNYTCVAENLINRRVSPPARLDIFGIKLVSFTISNKNVSSPFFHLFPLWC